MGKQTYKQRTDFWESMARITKNEHDKSLILKILKDIKNEQKTTDSKATH